MPKPDKQLERQLEHIAVLGDPVRRALYLYVSRNAEVSRDQAARALRTSRAVAAFHLDKLLDAGLLEASYRRLSGRAGPGAGRPSKLYRRSALQVDVTLPARRYEVAARLLVEATREGGATALASLERAAEAWGRQIGSEARQRAGARAAPARLLRHALETLESAGFEPRHTGPGGDIVLGNCPFDALRAGGPPIVCRMNVALCRGFLAGLEASEWTVRFEPRPDRCCVAIQTH